MSCYCHPQRHVSVICHVMLMSPYHVISPVTVTPTVNQYADVCCSPSPPPERHVSAPPLHPAPTWHNGWHCSQDVSEGTDTAQGKRISLRAFSPSLSFSLTHTHTRRRTCTHTHCSAVPQWPKKRSDCHSVAAAGKQAQTHNITYTTPPLSQQGEGEE